MFTDLRDLSEFGCCWFEVRGLIPDTLHEQIDCCAIGTRFEWAKLDQALAGNSETFLAGGEHPSRVPRGVSREISVESPEFLIES